MKLKDMNERLKKNDDQNHIKITILKSNYFQLKNYLLWAIMNTKK